MNFYLRTKSTPVPFEIDADAFKFWLARALNSPSKNGANLAAFLPRNGRAGIIDAITAQRVLKVINAFAMDDADEGDETLTLAASRLFQACRNPPLTVSEK